MYDDPGKALVGLRGPRDRKRAHISLRYVFILNFCALYDTNHVRLSFTYENAPIIDSLYAFIIKVTATSNFFYFRVMGILKKFLDVSMTKNFPEEGGMATLTKYFNEIVPPSIDVSVRLGKTDFLFEKVKILSIWLLIFLLAQSS